jgi:TusA-related sulfurtransferase
MRAGSWSSYEVECRVEGWGTDGNREPYRYDAGDLGCGDGLPRELRRHISQIPVGARLEVTVRDPAARADLPPLVRLMGHRILSEEAHPDGRLVIEVERSR